jgi:hypothetical protein
MLHTFLLLVFLHYLGDYPLQGEFLAKAKNRTIPIPGVPWYQALGAHAIIHGGLVLIATGSALLFVLETAIHAITDDLKCRGKLTFNQDQAIHIICKLIYTIILSVI